MLEPEKKVKLTGVIWQLYRILRFSSESFAILRAQDTEKNRL